METLHHFTFRDALAASRRANWAIEDVFPDTGELDFGRDFMPESLARTDALRGLSSAERRTLNHIRAHEYLSIFGIVEEFILPFLLDHIRPELGDDHRIRALLQFAGEEAKHIHLFRLFHRRFAEGFGHECAVIGPAEAIGAEVLRHDPLAVALLILQIEWMTQLHYVGSVRDDEALDPLFSSLLRHHWMEEAQHAKLDTLLVEAIAGGRDADGIAKAVKDHLALIAFLDGGLRGQVDLNLTAFEAAIGRDLAPADRIRFRESQLQALRWTYIGSGLSHPKFVATLAAISPEARDRIVAMTPAFC